MGSEKKDEGEECKANEGKDFTYPSVLHPNNLGMAHVMGTIDRIINRLKAEGNEVKFAKYEDCAELEESATTVICINFGNKTI